jgi:hypothetical protein
MIPSKVMTTEPENNAVKFFARKLKQQCPSKSSEEKAKDQTNNSAQQGEMS